MDKEKAKKVAKILGKIAAILVVVAFLVGIVAEGFKACSKQETEEKVLVVDSTETLVTDTVYDDTAILFQTDSVVEVVTE